MSIKGSFNIFQTNYIEPQKSDALAFFSTINYDKQNQNQQTSVMAVKKKNFTNQIRKQYRQSFKRSSREKMRKLLLSNQLFLTLQRLSSGNQIQSKNISNLLMDLKRNMNDQEFCKNLDQNNKIKDFILNLYLQNYKQSPIDQKTLLVQSLVYLTYYSNGALDKQDTFKLLQAIQQQLRFIVNYDFQSINYIGILIDLNTNIIYNAYKVSKIKAININLLYNIVEKINGIWKSGQIALKQHNDQTLHAQMLEQIQLIREMFLGTLANLSYYDFQDQQLQKLIIDQFTKDISYVHNFTTQTISILSYLVQSQRFRWLLLQQKNLTEWFLSFVIDTAQKRFTKSIYLKQQFLQGISMSQDQIDSFYSFLTVLTRFVSNENDQQLMKLMQNHIYQNISMHCLSQFLIQCADHKQRKSKYVSRAIQMYQILADLQTFDYNKLMTVTNQRTFEDIIKVLLDPTYFTSYKISSYTLSVLNKLLSKNIKLVQTLVQLRVFDSIQSFLDGVIQVQTANQISNFIDFLTLMIASDDQLKKYDKEKGNQIVKMINYEMRRKIQFYQDHEDRQVAKKAQTFLQFLQSYNDSQYSRQEDQI